MGQDFAAFGGDQHVVFDADPAPVGQIDPRLDGHDHARLEDGVGPAAKLGGFVDVQAQTVAEAVAKKAAETGLLNDGAGFGVHIASRHAGTDRGDSALLGRQDDPVDFRELRCDLTGDQNPRQVTLIRSPRRSPVDQHEIGVADPGVGGWARVRQGGAATDGHDRREARAGGPATS